jgi:hypothetical protein
MKRKRNQHRFINKKGNQKSLRDICIKIDTYEERKKFNYLFLSNIFLSEVLYFYLL